MQTETTQQRRPFYLQSDPPREESRIEVEVEVRPKLHNTFRPDGTWNEDGHVFRTSIPGHEGLLSTGTHKLWIYESDLPLVESLVEDKQDVLERAKQRCQRRIMQKVGEMIEGEFNADDPDQLPAFQRVMATHGHSVEAEFQDMMDAEYGDRRGVKKLVRVKPTGKTAGPPVDKQVSLVQQTVREIMGHMQGGGGGELQSLRKENAELKDRLDRLEAALGEKPADGGGKRGKG